MSGNEEFRLHSCMIVSGLMLVFFIGNKQIYGGSALVVFTMRKIDTILVMLVEQITPDHTNTYFCP